LIEAMPREAGGKEKGAARTGAMRCKHLALDLKAEDGGG
jgi:hypothetical protein